MERQTCKLLIALITCFLSQIYAKCHYVAATVFTLQSYLCVMEYNMIKCEQKYMLVWLGQAAPASSWWKHLKSTLFSFEIYFIISCGHHTMQDHWSLPLLSKWKHGTLDQRSPWPIIPFSSLVSTTLLPSHRNLMIWDSTCKFD